MSVPDGDDDDEEDDDNNDAVVGTAVVCSCSSSSSFFVLERAKMVRSPSGVDKLLAVDVPLGRLERALDSRAGRVTCSCFKRATKSLQLASLRRKPRRLGQSRAPSDAHCASMSTITNRRLTAAKASVHGNSNEGATDGTESSEGEEEEEELEAEAEAEETNAGTLQVDSAGERTDVDLSVTAAVADGSRSAARAVRRPTPATAVSMRHAERCSALSGSTEGIEVVVVVVVVDGDDDDGDAVAFTSAPSPEFTTAGDIRTSRTTFFGRALLLPLLVFSLRAQRSPNARKKENSTESAKADSERLRGTDAGDGSQ